MLERENGHPKRILDSAAVKPSSNPFYSLKPIRILSPLGKVRIWRVLAVISFCMAVTSSSNVIIHQKCSRPPPERISHPVDNDVKL